MNKVTVTTKKEIEELANQSALTREGVILEELDTAYAQVLSQYTDISNCTAHIISGAIMNKAYRLTGSNAYPADSHIVAFTGVDTSKLIFARFQYGFRWLDDIIDNNRCRQRAS